MLKTTFLPTPLIFDLEFEGHAVGMSDEIWHPKTRIIGLPDSEETIIVCQTIWAQSTSVTLTDIRTEG